MNYKYDPHSHVKIWLSKNPNVFMNFENQMRLIDMRERNPHDRIHLIYDSALLHTKAQDALQRFCEENNITPIDADEFKHALCSEREKTLYRFYKDEITHLNAGGNLGVASDIIRWLSSVYKLGTYTDFDVPVDTSTLDKSIAVEAPLLLNIGSLNIGNKEFILSNNDYIAVVDEEAGQEKIEAIQDGIIETLSQYDTDFMESTENALGSNHFINQYIVKFLKTRSEAIYIQKSKDIASSLSSRELRAYICKIMQNEQAFIDFNKQNSNETRAMVIQRLREEMQGRLGFLKRLFFKNEYEEIKKALAQNDQHFLAYLMKKEKSLFIKSIVICTTGPLKIAECLFGGSVLSNDEVTEQVAPYSFNAYALHKAFRSTNTIGIHENLLGMFKFITAEDGELNDSSWLEEGIALQKKREAQHLEQRDLFSTRLPWELTRLKLKIERHVLKLNRNSKGFWGLFGLIIKAKKITALMDVLDCFNHKNNDFDIHKFKVALAKIEKNKKYIFSGLFLSHSKQLIQDLDKICHQSVIYRLTNGKKITLSPSSYQKLLSKKTFKHVHQASKQKQDEKHIWQPSKKPSAPRMVPRTTTSLKIRQPQM